MWGMVMPFRTRLVFPGPRSEHRPRNLGLAARGRDPGSCLAAGSVVGDLRRNVVSEFSLPEREVSEVWQSCSAASLIPENRIINWVNVKSKYTIILPLGKKVLDYNFVLRYLRGLKSSTSVGWIIDSITNNYRPYVLLPSHLWAT